MSARTRLVQFTVADRAKLDALTAQQREALQSALGRLLLYGASNSGDVLPSIDHVNIFLDKDCEATAAYSRPVFYPDTNAGERYYSSAYAAIDDAEKAVAGAIIEHAGDQRFVLGAVPHDDSGIRTYTFHS